MKAVVVHRGRRDAYQVARAFSEAGELDRLVTDLYWPADRGWARHVSDRTSLKMQSLLNARHAAGLLSASVQSCWFSGLVSLACEKLAFLPFQWRRGTTRWSDRVLGNTAGRLARRNGSVLVSYSYYGHSSFSSYGKPGILFQLHPHPSSVRRILLDELHAHPETSASLEQEWELALPERDFRRLVQEVKMADAWIVASSFTRETLIENGIPANRIGIAPYGVDLDHFQPVAAERPCSTARPLRLLFVGRIVQRKGIKYLLEAIKQLPRRHLDLTIAGRAVDDLQLLRELSERITLRCHVSDSELRSLYQSCDLLVLPSVAEGFGQVLLEALASGLPILSTTSTAAPDLISQGCEGWFVPPCRVDRLVERIDWALCNRRQLELMRGAARERATKLTWQRFRKRIRELVQTFSRTQALDEVLAGV